MSGQALNGRFDCRRKFRMFVTEVFPERGRFRLQVGSKLSMGLLALVFQLGGTGLEDSCQ